MRSLFDLSEASAGVGELGRVDVGHLDLRVESVDTGWVSLSEAETHIIDVNAISSNWRFFKNSKFNSSLFFNNFMFILFGFPLSFLNTFRGTYSSSLLRLLSVRLVNSVSTLFMSNCSLKMSLTLSASTTQLVIGLTSYFFSTGMLDVSIYFSSSLLD